MGHMEDPDDDLEDDRPEIVTSRSGEALLMWEKGTTTYLAAGPRGVVDVREVR